ncbi:MAG: hypothetical protein WCZ86_06215 [Desulfurivibrionaceae bacterium]
MNDRKGMLNAAFLTLAAVGMAGMGPELTARAFSEAQPRKAKGRWVLDWVKSGGDMVHAASVSGTEATVTAHCDGFFAVFMGDDLHLIHEGRAKNYTLNNAKNAAERWLSLNRHRIEAMETRVLMGGASYVSHAPKRPRGEKK